MDLVIGKYEYYVFTSIKPYVHAVMTIASDYKNFVVLVTNHLRETSDADLHNVFQPYGNVISAKVVVCTYTGMTGGFGFVQFDNRVDAQRAIHKLDGTIPNHIDATIGVEWAAANPTTAT